MAFLNKGLTITLTDERAEVIDDEAAEVAEAPKSAAEEAEEAAQAAPRKSKTRIYHYRGGRWRRSPVLGRV